MIEAMYYEKVGNKEVICQLCPHYCRIKEARTGICRVRKNIDGSLYSLNYGMLTSYAYDPIEKKPLYHFYPKSTIFSIGSFGCNLSCDFCQNWQIVYLDDLSIEVSDEEILKLAGGRGSIGLAFTYNEPTIYYEYMLNLSKKAKDLGLKNIIVTNGFINEEPLKALLPYIDGMNVDLKSIDDSFYKKLCGGSVDPVINTIELASKMVHVEVTSLIIDGENSSKESIEKLAKRIGQIDKNIPLHLSRYFPAYKMTNPPTRLESLVEGKELAEKYLNYVYIGNVPNL